MTETGILFRRACKSLLIAQPPIPGEMVFATDTGEHGWLNENNILVWKSLINSSGSGLNTGLESVVEDNHLGWRLIGKNPLMYSPIGRMAVDISESNTISGASGEYSFAASYNTIAQNRSQTSLGQFNVGKADDTILEVGIGLDDEDRLNAFEIYSDGRIWAPNLNFNNIIEPQSLITKAYIDDIAAVIKYDRNGTSGYGLHFRDYEFFDTIGENSFDVSISTDPFGIMGASGKVSFAAGFNNLSEGSYSTTFGAYNESKGSYSTALGSHNKAYADTMLAIGRYNIGEDLSNIFEIGYGEDEDSRANIFEVSQSGTVIAPKLSLELISNPKCLITKEYFDIFKTGTFINLPDTPDQYIPDKFVAVNSTGTALEFVNTPEGLQSQLEKIIEVGKTGWRLYGADPDLYGYIGEHAIDLTKQEYHEDTWNYPIDLYSRGATGDYSFAFGKYSWAKGSHSFAYGMGRAEGSYSFAVGNSIATGDFSVARGNTNYRYNMSTASGYYSEVLGSRNNAEGSYSKAEGYWVSSSGSSGLAYGSDVTSTGSYSFTLGTILRNNSNYSINIGHNNTSISSTGTSMIGHNLYSTESGVFIIGQYNEDVQGVNFIVGNGSTDDDNRSNSLEVYESGKILAPRFDSTAYTNPSDTDPKMLVTLEYMKVYWADIHDGTGLELVGEEGNQGWRFIGTEPDFYGNIGEKSVDFSYSDVYSTTLGATGDYSAAFGKRTTASGFCSIAYGMKSIAEGDYSIVQGYNSITKGNYSFALGEDLYIDGDNTFMIGSGLRTLNTDNSTSQDNVFMMGVDNYSVGGDSFTYGKGSINSQGSISIGNYNSITPYYAYGPTDNVAIGKGLKINRIGSTAFGYYNVDNMNSIGSILSIGIGTSDSNRKDAINILTSGQILAPSLDLLEIIDKKALVTKEYVDEFGNSSGLERLGEISDGVMKIGYRLIGMDPDSRANIGDGAIDMTMGGTGTQGAPGDYSFAVGLDNTAYGYKSVALGANNLAEGAYSFTANKSNHAWGSYSIAMGQETSAGHYSMTFGYKVSSQFSYSLAFGTYNVGKADSLMEIGYGDYLESRNVFEVSRFGQVLAPQLDMDEITDPKCLITREFFDAYYIGNRLYINDDVTDLDTTWSSTYIDSHMASKEYVDNSVAIIDDYRTLTFKTWSSAQIDAKISPLASRVYVDESIKQVSLNSGFDDNNVSLYTGYSSQKIVDTYPTFANMEESIQVAIDQDIVGSIIDDDTLAYNSTYSSNKIINLLEPLATETYVDDSIANIALDSIINDDTTATDTTWSSTYIDANFYTNNDIDVLFNTLIDDDTTATDTTWSSTYIMSNISNIINDDVTETTTTWSSTKISSDMTTMEDNFNTALSDLADTISDTNGDLLSDGSVDMSSDYTPVNDFSIATKIYVDDNTISSFSDLIDTPDTLGNAFNIVSINSDSTALKYTDINNFTLDNYLNIDGNILLIDGYEPSEDMSIATKIYVDDKVISASELEKIIEGDNTGWRLKDANALRYGNIGEGAVDLSYSTESSDTKGATGNYSFAFGLDVEAGNDYMTVIGVNNNLKLNTLFEIGNGNSDSNSNALEVYSDGNILAPSLVTIDDPKSLVTKEYVDNNIPSGVILSDGTIDMDDGYTPNNLLSIATKEYVDNNIPSGVILSDGTIDMDDGYVPNNLLSIATKEYVDNNIPDNLLLSDGTIDMDDGYVPNNLLSIATKEYVDNNIPDNLLLSDGSITMDESYEAINEQDIATVKTINNALIDIEAVNQRNRFIATSNQSLFIVNFEVDTNSLVFVDGTIQPLKSYEIVDNKVIMNESLSEGTDVIIMK